MSKMSNYPYIEKRLETPIPDKTISELVFENADLYADKVCQIDITTGEQETFKSLKLRSIRLAIQLYSQFNLTTKDVIFTCAYNSIHTPLPVLAGLFLGCTVSHSDPSFKAWQTTHLINSVEPTLIFVDLDNLALIKDSLKNVKKSAKIIVFGETAEYTNMFDLIMEQKDEEKFHPVPLDLDEVAFILFTSGTTGLPKGASHTHRSFMVVTAVKELFPEDINIQMHCSTFYWISGLISLLRSFLYGRTRAFYKRLDPDVVLRGIEKYQINCMFSAPVISFCLVNAADFSKYDTRSLKRMFLAGTVTTVPHLKKFQAAFPHTKVMTAYGQTEAGIVAMSSCDGTDDKLKSVGELVEGMKLKIVDPDTNCVVGANKTGEVCVKSPTMMSGYYKLDNTHVFDQDGWLKTGDVGYYDTDESIYIVERLKEMFKYKTCHVVPAMIESILEEHPAVEEAVVFGLPSQSVEEGDLPSACIILKKFCKVNEDEIRQFVSERVSEKQQLRGVVVFLDSLPRGPSGKVVRKDVKDMMMERYKTV